MASNEEILEVVEELSRIYGKKPDTITGYYWALEDMPMFILKKAAKKAAKSNQWMPKPAELLRMAEEIQQSEMHAAPGGDQLLGEWIETQKKYYRHDEYNPEACQKLLEQLRRLGRDHLADTIQLRINAWETGEFPEVKEFYQVRQR